MTCRGPGEWSLRFNNSRTIKLTLQRNKKHIAILDPVKDTRKENTRVKY